MTKGSCLCGAVAFEIDPAGIVLSVGCFCSNCRKVSGTQYGVYLQVKHSSFRWLKGEDRVASFESSPGNKRGFCRSCGSIAPIATTYGAVRVPGGALDEDPGTAPEVVLFTADKVDWCSLDSAKNTFVDTGPADFWSSIVARLYARD